jgi:hypothetical protein
MEPPVSGIRRCSRVNLHAGAANVAGEGPSGLIAGCFVGGPTIEYRGVYLLLVTPGL